MQYVCFGMFWMFLVGQELANKISMSPCSTTAAVPLETKSNQEPYELRVGNQCCNPITDECLAAKSEDVPAPNYTELISTEELTQNWIAEEFISAKHRQAMVIDPS